MKKKKRHFTSTKKWLVPNKTKILLIIAGILIVLGILSLSLSVEYGLLTNETAMTAGWILLGASAVMLLIDTLAQDRSTKMIRLAGLIFALLYVLFRYF